jgi:hypothetical protein
MSPKTAAQPKTGKAKPEKNSTSAPALDPGTLVDALRLRDDHSMRLMLIQRPDLVHPVPTDMAKLAARAATNSSVTRVLDRLDAWTVGVAEVISVLVEPFTKKDLENVLNNNDRIDVALEKLRLLAIIWGTYEGMRFVPVLKEVVAPHPAGFGPCFLHERPDLAAIAKFERIQEIVSKGPKGTEEVLNELLWGPPVITLSKLNRDAGITSAKNGHEYLMAHGVLVATARDALTLPREIALVMRTPSYLPEDLSNNKDIKTKAQRDPIQVDRAAGAAGLQFVQLVEELLDNWGETPPAVLRNGGLAQRDLTIAAKICNEDENIASLLSEIAFSAGLLAAGDDKEQVWLPTPAFDVWRTKSVEERWAILAEAWLTTTRVASLVGKVGEIRINALSPEVDKALAPEIRSLVLDAMAAIEPGFEPDQDAIVEYVTWLRPRKNKEEIETLVKATLGEANTIGIRGLGVLATTGRALGEMRYTMPSPEARTAAARAAVADPKGYAVKPDPMLVSAIAPLLPDAIATFVLQADLTAVIPGPPAAEVASELRHMAYQESRGAAQVFRFTESSLQRAMERGYTAERILEFLNKYTTTSVPQPLEYLINDLVRKLGDIKQIDEPIDDAIPAPNERRSPARVRPRPAPEGAPPDAALLDAAIKALRAGEDPKAKPVTPAAAPNKTPASEIAELFREVVDKVISGSTPSEMCITLTYVDTHGMSSNRIVEPIRFEGGLLTGFDLTESRIRDYAISRIAGAEKGKK